MSLLPEETPLTLPSSDSLPPPVSCPTASLTLPSSDCAYWPAYWPTGLKKLPLPSLWPYCPTGTTYYWSYCPTSENSSTLPLTSAISNTYSSTAACLMMLDAQSAERHYSTHTQTHISNTSVEHTLP